MIKIVLASAIFFLITGCKSIGVIESSDPKVKIADGYRVMQDGRPIPAKRLFEEASAIAQQGSDESLKAHALVALGDVYKFKGGREQTQHTYNIQKSITSYEEAAKILEKLKYNQRLSMAYFGLSQAYMAADDAGKFCPALIKAAKAFYEPSGGVDDQLDENIKSKIAPYFEAIKGQNYKVFCEIRDARKDIKNNK